MVLAAGLSVGACGGSSPRLGAAAAGTPSSVQDGRGAADLPVDAGARPGPADSAIRDTAVAGLDVFSRSDGAGADLGAPAADVPDAAVHPDVPPTPDAAPLPDLAPPSPDTPLPRECTPGVRACLEGMATRQCSEEGRWLPGEGCAAGSTCSGGACVCAAGSCEDGVMRDEPGYIAEIAVAGTILHYRYAMGLGTDIRSLDLRTGAFGGVMPPAAGYGVSPGLAADASGALFWCRRNTDDMGPIDGALMLGDQVFAPGACSRPLATPTHVLFMLDDETGLFQVSRASAAPIRSETITSKYPASFFATATHLYFASADDGPRLWSRIERVPLDDFTRPQTVAERDGFDTHIFDHMAVDDTDLYVSYQGQILRSPAAGGDFQNLLDRRHHRHRDHHPQRHARLLVDRGPQRARLQRVHLLAPLEAARRRADPAGPARGRVPQRHGAHPGAPLRRHRRPSRSFPNPAPASLTRRPAAPPTPGDFFLVNPTARVCRSAPGSFVAPMRPTNTSFQGDHP